MDPSETGALPDALKGVPHDVLMIYRKIAMATVSVYLELPDAFADAILLDAMDEYLAESFNDREMLKRTNYAAYLSLMGREAIVRYAGTAAEGLAAPPDSPLAQKRVMGDTGDGLGMTDDINAVLRVQELWASLEAPGGDGACGADANTLLSYLKRQTCNYYNACAFHLVREKLLPVILDVAEAAFRSADGTDLTAHRLIYLLDQRGLLLS
jgi:hypothetical protein